MVRPVSYLNPTRPMSRRRRSQATDAPLGRVLTFPVRANPEGQIELFPEPVKPDPHSPSQLIIAFTLLQYRVTRIASHLAPSERLHLFGEYHQVLPTLERYEELTARRRQREAAALLARIA